MIAIELLEKATKGFVDNKLIKINKNATICILSSKDRSTWKLSIFKDELREEEINFMLHNLKNFILTTKEY